MALKRISKSHDCIVTLEIFDGENGLRDFKEVDFRLCLQGFDFESVAYPFSAEDFLADDWEVGFDDCYSPTKLFKSFKEYLLDRYGDTLLDYNDALAKTKEFFSKVDGDDISRIDIAWILNDNKIATLTGETRTIKDWFLTDTLSKARSLVGLKWIANVAQSVIGKRKSVCKVAISIMMIMAIRLRWQRLF